MVLFRLTSTPRLPQLSLIPIYSFTLTEFPDSEGLPLKQGAKSRVGVPFKISAIVEACSSISHTYSSITKLRWQGLISTLSDAIPLPKM